MITFIQSFGVNSPGGGARILRGLLEFDHPLACSISTSVENAPRSSSITEIHLPLRPNLGRFERSRFHNSIGVLDGAFQRRTENRISKALKFYKTDGIHLIAQSFEIVPVQAVAARLRIPVFLSVHDDIEYGALAHPMIDRIRVAMKLLWNNANARFVISEEIGREYCERYGHRPYILVTDGLSTVARIPRPQNKRSLRIYFMGLFHYGYRPNFSALLDAMEAIALRCPDWEISVTCRCGSLPISRRPNNFKLQVLPFGSEADVEQDMMAADCLYMPLPLEPEAQNFTRFSLSTKMITYLGSGLPMFYHGPANAAAAKLLRENNAAMMCNSLEASVIAEELIAGVSNKTIIVENALKLAASKFMLNDQQSKFWGPINTFLNSNRRATCLP